MKAWKRLKHRLRKWILHRLREFTPEEKLLAQYRLGREHERQEQELAAATWPLDAQLSPQELEAIRVEHLFRQSARHAHEERITNAETQRLPVEQVRRIHDEMRRHGSSE